MPFHGGTILLFKCLGAALTRPGERTATGKLQGEGVLVLSSPTEGPKGQADGVSFLAADSRGRAQTVGCRHRLRWLQAAITSAGSRQLWRERARRLSKEGAAFYPGA